MAPNPFCCRQAARPRPGQPKSNGSTSTLQRNCGRARGRRRGPRRRERRAAARVRRPSPPVGSASALATGLRRRQRAADFDAARHCGRTGGEHTRSGNDRPCRLRHVRRAARQQSRPVAARCRAVPAAPAARTRHSRVAAALPAEGCSGRCVCSSTSPGALGASGASGDLHDQLRQALAGAEIGAHQALVHADDHRQRHRRQVVALGQHLGAHDQRRLAAQQFVDGGGEARLACWWYRDPAAPAAIPGKASASAASSRSVPAPCGTSARLWQFGQDCGGRCWMAALVAAQPGRRRGERSARCRNPGIRRASRSRGTAEPGRSRGGS